VCSCLAVQSCLTLCDPMDCSPRGSSVHGILQTRILEWVAMPSSRGSSQPRAQTDCRWILYHLSHQGKMLVDASPVVLAFKEMETKTGIICYPLYVESENIIPGWPKCPSVPKSSCHPKVWQNYKWKETVVLKQFEQMILQTLVKHHVSTLLGPLLAPWKVPGQWGFLKQAH